MSETGPENLQSNLTEFHPQLWLVLYHVQLRVQFPVFRQLFGGDGKKGGLFCKRKYIFFNVTKIHSDNCSETITYILLPLKKKIVVSNLLLTPQLLYYVVIVINYFNDLGEKMCSTKNQENNCLIENYLE